MNAGNRSHLRLVEELQSTDLTTSDGNTLPSSINVFGEPPAANSPSPDAPAERLSLLSKRLVSRASSARTIGPSTFPEARLHPEQAVAINPADLHVHSKNNLRFRNKTWKVRGKGRNVEGTHVGQLEKRAEGHENSAVNDVSSETVRRLEDRIDAAEERGTLRLAEAMAKLDARFAGLGAQMQGISDRLTRLETTASSTQSDIANSRRTLLAWLIPCVIGTGVAVAALLYTGQANMMGAFQTGLTAGPAVEVSVKRAVEDALRAAPR